MQNSVEETIKRGGEGNKKPKQLSNTLIYATNVTKSKTQSFAVYVERHKKTNKRRSKISTPRAHPINPKYS